MFRFKILAFVTIIILAFLVVAVGDAVAGEKVKTRTVKYIVKWEQIKVGDEEGHIVAVFETKGISTNLQGRPFADGWVVRETSLIDMNEKTGTMSAGHGYGETTDRDGDKYYFRWEGKQVGGRFRIETSYVKGTGKFEGISGKGTASVHMVGEEMLYYSEAELEVELLGR